MANLTKSQIRDILDEKKIFCKVDDDGDLYIVLEADDDFPGNVIVWFKFHEYFVEMMATSDWDISYLSTQRQLDLLNHLGSSCRFVNSFIKDGKELRISMEGFFGDAAPSREYLKAFYQPAFIWTSYKKAYQFVK